MNSEKSVVISIPVLFVGGTEIQTLNLVRVHVNAGYDVTVCCYYEHDASMVQRFESAGAKVILMKYERTDGLWHLAKGLIKLFKALKPNVIHIQYLAPGLVPIIASRLAGIRAIFVTVHQPGSTYGLKEKLFIRVASWLSTAFFCVSRSVEVSWFGDSEVFDPEKPLRRKHFTIYNAVDTDQVAEAVRLADQDGLRKSLSIKGKKVIGFVGRIRREKGLDVLIDAFPHIHKSQPNAVLVVVGDGPDRASLKQRAECLGVDAEIRWLGQKSIEEVRELYSIMDVVAIPSRFEGFGLVAAEAMAAGLPVVASLVDGLKEIIINESVGLLVPEGNSRVLARTIYELLNAPDKARFMGENGRKYIEGSFSFNNYRKIIVESYRHYFRKAYSIL